MNPVEIEADIRALDLMLGSSMGPGTHVVATPEPAPLLSRWITTRKAHRRWLEAGVGQPGGVSRSTFVKRAIAAGVRRWSIGYDGRWWSTEDLGRLMNVANIPVTPSDRYGEPPERRYDQPGQNP